MRAEPVGQKMIGDPDAFADSTIRISDHRAGHFFGVLSSITHPLRGFFMSLPRIHGIRRELGGYIGHVKQYFSALQIFMLPANSNDPEC
uniref:AlNc14C281G10107 protein n=1 Tax=Albugo laibachii Nc14 TaxID=890382 RepID=F0WUV9_9STRA|nr:AlNc14C281G10107 [Albugo laibachii Nc14]|eukprot:CCA25195.1 AlNc14C281G10107 [Albugo laibachii Nc14]